MRIRFNFIFTRVGDTPVHTKDVTGEIAIFTFVVPQVPKTFSIPPYLKNSGDKLLLCSKLE